MQQAMQSSSLHREFRGFLDAELSCKDFAASDTELLDSIIASLVTSYDADELPIRREQEYEQLIIDLEGNMKLANGAFMQGKCAYAEIAEVVKSA